MHLTSTVTPSIVPRCMIIILVWLIARFPATSQVEPPRKCMILTPRSNPSRLTRMKSDAGPWNQVAVIHASSCQTVRKASQFPASRKRTQFSITSRISAFSSARAMLAQSFSSSISGTFLRHNKFETRCVDASRPVPLGVTHPRPHPQGTQGGRADVGRRPVQIGAQALGECDNGMLADSVRPEPDHRVESRHGGCVDYVTAVQPGQVRDERAD